MNLDKITELCNEADLLLTAHEDDATIQGYGRTLAQCKFARLGYPLLALLRESVLELVNEVEQLKADLARARMRATSRAGRLPQ